MTSYRSLLRNAALAAVLPLFAAGCVEQHASNTRSIQPIPAKLVAEMEAKGMNRTSPILVRAYKQEGELEIWKQTSGGKYALLKSYPVCRWSGQLGPKRDEGDRQVPEGFYSVSASQLNPNSQFYLSYDVGYPNSYDRALGRSGGDIMVHGSCSSRGCFAMTDEQVAEIYAITREALQGGQPSFQFQSLPFRMTAENLARHRKNPNIAFWKNLKEGADTFEVTKKPVDVAVCNSRYSFNGQGAESCGGTPDPAIASAVAAKRQRDDAQVAALVSAGTPAVAYLYQDGSSNPVFAARAAATPAPQGNSSNPVFATQAVSASIPGRDRPFTSDMKPTIVALDGKGAPATEDDAGAAALATRSAAETLLRSEAIVAHRPATSDPTAIEARQRTVYTRLIGKTPQMLPSSVQVSQSAQVSQQAAMEPQAVPASKPAVVASAAPAPVPAEESSFFARMFGSDEAKPVQEPRVAAIRTSPVIVASKPAAKPVVRPNAPVNAAVASDDEEPFYKRWLGLGSDEAAPQPAASEDPVMLPPAKVKRRTATLPPNAMAYADAY